MSETLRFGKYDLDSSIEVARTIYERGGGAVSQDQLATMLSYASTQNGAFINRIAAARLYGLVEGRGTVRPTELAMRIIAPVYERDAAEARLEAFLNVPLNRAFYEGNKSRQLPGMEGIRNALISQFGVPKNQVARAAARLMDSAEQAGLFEVAGGRSRMVEPVLRGSSSETSGTEPTGADEQESSDTGEPTSQRARTVDVAARGYPAIVEAALQALPDERKWNEDELVEWLNWFEGALRIHFRLPRARSGRPGGSNGGGPNLS
jgi:hypothetical protein